MTQRPLPLPDGFHVGPLFVIRKQRMDHRVRTVKWREHEAQTRRATPKWLTTEQRREIARMYAWARRLTRWTGELHVVDHIVPKIGKTVRGLHVPWNLRVIHWRANTLKGHHWWPDMWNEQLELL